jgi:hypothetical protein
MSRPSCVKSSDCSFLLVPVGTLVSDVVIYVPGDHANFYPRVLRPSSWHSSRDVLHQFVGLLTHLIHAHTREVTRSRLFDSVPNFILAFIPAEINPNTLNTMTAFAVCIWVQTHPGPSEKFGKRLICTV